MRRKNRHPPLRASALVAGDERNRVLEQERVDGQAQPDPGAITRKPRRAACC